MYRAHHTGCLRACGFPIPNLLDLHTVKKEKGRKAWASLSRDAGRASASQRQRLPADRARLAGLSRFSRDGGSTSAGGFTECTCDIGWVPDGAIVRPRWDGMAWETRGDTLVSGWMDVDCERDNCVHTNGRGDVCGVWALRWDVTRSRGQIGLSFDGEKQPLFDALCMYLNRWQMVPKQYPETNC